MAAQTLHSKKHKVCVVGSGNWGTTIAKVVAENTKENPDLFDEEVQMWVYEEEYQIPKDSKHYEPGSALCTKPQKLTQLINGLCSIRTRLSILMYLPNPIQASTNANPYLLIACPSINAPFAATSSV